MTTGVYTYHMVDIISNNILAELPLYGVHLTRIINKAGNATFSCKLDIEDSVGITNNDILGSTQPGRIALWAERDGKIIWAGPIWSRTYNSSSKSIEMSGQTFESYLAKRFLRTDKAYTNTDGRNIAIDLINTMQAVPYGNIGIQVPATFANDNPIESALFYAYSYQKYFDIMDKLARQGAFDWTIEPSFNNGVPTLTLQLGYPRLGVSGSASNVVFEFPGNILQYWFPENASNGRNRSWAIGNGEGTTMLTSSSDDTASLTAGYPLLEDMNAYKNESVQASLDMDASADLALYTLPIVIPTFLVRPGLDPVFGSYGLGDDIFVTLNDPARFPTPFSGYYRMVQWDITPGSSEASEELNVTIGGVDGSV